MCRIIAVTIVAGLFAGIASAAPLPGTHPLVTEKDTDITSELVAGVDRFLLKQLDAANMARSGHWKRDLSSPDEYSKSVAKNRQRLSYILGLRDDRVPYESPQLVGSLKQSAQIGGNDRYAIHRIRYPVIHNIHAEGLLLVPARPNGIDVVAIPDADITPEALVGLTDEVGKSARYAHRLAQSGCRVIVPALISRTTNHPYIKGNLTNREFLYRSAYELGRTMIGIEVQKVLAAVDWMERDQKSAGTGNPSIAIMGWGEGGLLALYSAAVDQRIDAACVSGYFDSRQDIWQEPMSRNVFALLEQFGDAELATLVSPRALIVEASRAPELEITGDGGRAPSRIVTPKLDVVKAEVARAYELMGGKKDLANIRLIVSGDGTGPAGTQQALKALLESVKEDVAVAKFGSVPASDIPEDSRVPAKREERQFKEINVFTQWCLRESPFVRKEFMKDLDTSSVEAYEKSAEKYRDYFRHEVIGHFDLELLPPNVRTRQVEESDLWVRYEVVMDVFEDVIAYGLLTLPKGIKAGEKRPVVVCQHGLEGRPQDTIGESNFKYYIAFATKLAERGFVTFAPQNLYIFRDRFRTLQRKSYAIKKTLFSTIVPQHQQIVDWLQSLSFVDPDHVAFYGLSYGGKSAMRIPPLVTDYCLSICSADFNEWVLKNASTRHRFSYIWHGEYEIFEWDLGSTFNYAEMAYLICPRPFMVERGHFDGVGEDEWVGYEFAKVRHMYQGKLKIGELTEIEWFDGPHKINGVGTYDFLHRHLEWPAPDTEKK